MTRADHVSGSDRIFEALEQVDPAGPRPDRRQRAGRPADARARRPQGRARAARRSRGRYRDARRRDHKAGGARPIPTWSRWWARRSRRAACARSISPAPPRPPATGRSIITSGSMPIAAPRWRGSSSCRPRRSNSARGSSSFARWKPACASTSTIVGSVPLGVDTPEDLEAARAMLARALTQRRCRWSETGPWPRMKIAFQGEPGANSHLAIREAYPDAEAVPCATFEDAFAALTVGRRRRSA